MVGIKVRRNRAGANMKAALSFAAELGEYEDMHRHLGWGDHSAKANELFFATILFLAASLEASLNETIEDFRRAKKIDDDFGKSLLKSRGGMLKRYSILLEQVGEPRLNKGVPPRSGYLCDYGNA